MPPRMFEDLIASRPVTAGRGRARALPFSLAFHAAAVAAAVMLPQLVVELPPVAAAPPPPIPAFQRVQVVEIAQRTPPRPPDVTTRRAPPPSLPTTPSTPAAGTGAAVPADPSQMGNGTLVDDAPPLCFANCTGGEPNGVILPGPPDEGEGGNGLPTLRRAGRDVTPPAKLSGNAPVYPELAKRARIEGDVVIECTIDPSGRVVNAVVTRSIPVLDEAAIDAVRSWRYRPTLVDGVPVPVLMTVTVRFRIR